jgi:hypothetical protein
MPDYMSVGAGAVCVTLGKLIQFALTLEVEF